ncbi:hypothetical protein GDO86_000509 [Hymenochirus boettgeri]|uniref:Protein MGARP N-terminal domain-containing protein n=1 Tax=Hymenochirus boettgeri TaxID=247094 RepID=A0A8T2K9S3_9PIPI|nr:hypothetical protein GDO86_000509 [Hymenochirus boettgeri]
MYLCRAAWQKLVPMTRGAVSLLRNAPVRQMTSGSVPGSSGESLPYYLFVGCALTGAGIYLYRTLSRDQARFQDRHAYIESRPKPEVSPKPWPPQSEDESSNTPEVNEEATMINAVQSTAATEENKGHNTNLAPQMKEEFLLKEKEAPSTTEPTVELDAGLKHSGDETETINVSEAPKEMDISDKDEAIGDAVEEMERQEPKPLVLEEEELLIIESATEVEAEQLQEQNDNTTSDLSNKASDLLLEEVVANIPEEIVAALEDFPELSGESGEEPNTTGSHEVAEAEEVSTSS